MSLHFQWSYFGCSQPPGLCFHSDLRIAKEDYYPNIFRRSEDTYLPEIPQQTWSAGLLLTPDATALAREWEPIINVDPNHLPHRRSHKWNQLLPANGLPAGGVATYVNSGFLRERETVSFVGGGERQRDELIHTPDYIWENKLPECESRPYHSLAMWPWVSHFNLLNWLYHRVLLKSMALNQAFIMCFLCVRHVDLDRTQKWVKWRSTVIPWYPTALKLVGFGTRHILMQKCCPGTHHLFGMQCTS